MKLRHITMALLATLAISSYAQEPEANYRRSSIYSVMVNHTDQKFADEIKGAFLQIPVPDRFNDHNLSVKVLNLYEKLADAKSDKENATITTFLNNNKIASRLVARWFNRDAYTGQCDMELVKERGLYNASEFDKQLAKRSARGMAMLQDAGEELIGNTFVIVNDIRYIDKGKGSKAAGSFLRALGNIVDGAMGGGGTFSDMGDALGSMAESLKGFKVKINTFLYRLDWSDDQAALFYQEQYAARPDDKKRANFEQARGSYKLKYVGKVESSGSTTSFLGIKEDQPLLMVRKACQRAIDENVVDLQRAYEEFRAKSPLVSVEPLTAYIGMKEGVNEDSRYEVLEEVELENGKHKYNRVGIVEPVKNLIWDNRYMAVEEGATGATLGKTTFRKVSGGNFARGMLLREMGKK